MALECTETGEAIAKTEILYAATRDHAERIFALCNEVVSKIPQEKRLDKKRGVLEGGIDIHKASSDYNPHSDHHQISGFKVVEFLFSLNEEDAREYLPKTFEAMN